MRRKVILSFMVLSGVCCLIALAVWNGLLTPQVPETWKRIHVGMNRDEVLKLVGPAQISGWPEKVAETWQRNGMVCRHRLFVYYKGEQVDEVCEGTWLRGYGWLHPRLESR